MKRVLKLTSLFILLLIFNIGVVRAAMIVEEPRVAGYYGPRNEAHPEEEHPVLNIKINNNGTKTSAYCHNPGITAYTDSDVKSNASLIIDRKLGDASTTRAQNIYDEGLMTIISSECNESGCTYNDSNYTDNNSNYIIISSYEF